MKTPTGDLPAYELQQLCAADLDEVVGLGRDLFAETTWNASAVGRLLNASGCFALLARTAGQVTGLVLARAAADECEILRLVVLPSWRRRGIGLGLLQAGLRGAACLGARTAYLEVAEANRAAVALYDTEGFQPCGRRRSYYGSGREGGSRDALLYRKVLDSGEVRSPKSSENRVKVAKAQAS